MGTPPPPGGVGGLHNTMVALKLQQFQHYLKKIFPWRRVFPMLLGPSDACGSMLECGTTSNFVMKALVLFCGAWRVGGQLWKS